MDVALETPFNYIYMLKIASLFFFYSNTHIFSHKYMPKYSCHQLKTNAYMLNNEFKQKIEFTTFLEVSFKFASSAKSLAINHNRQRFKDKFFS